MLKINPDLEKTCHLAQRYILFSDRNYNDTVDHVRDDLNELIKEFKLSIITGLIDQAARLEN